jgi:4-azaleucine resistance transporter AzlC
MGPAPVDGARPDPVACRAMPGPDPMSHRAAFAAGARDIAPILVGLVPFGIIAGVAAIEAGLPTAQAIAASPMIFAGAAQLATMDLLGRGSPVLVVVLTALVINARFAMYSAALSGSFRRLGPGRKAVAAYLLTDQAFAVSVLRFSRHDETPAVRYAYYMGAALLPWMTWQLSTVAGVVLGAGVSPDLSLDFAIPLVFMALLFPAITDRATVTAAVAAAVAAAALWAMPLNLGLLTAAFVGIAAGMAAERRRRR